MKKLGSILIAVALLAVGLSFSSRAAAPYTLVTNPATCPHCVTLESAKGTILSSLRQSGQLQVSPSGVNTPRSLDFLPRLEYVENGQKTYLFQNAKYQRVNGQDIKLDSGTNLIEQKLDQISQGAQNQKPPSDSIICVVPPPGQTDRYGKKTDQPGQYPLQGKAQDLDDGATSPEHVKEEKLNSDIRGIGMPDEKTVNETLIKRNSQGGKPQLTGQLTRQQAQQYVDSREKPDPKYPGGSYEIDGVKVEAGKPYTAGKTDPTTGVKFDENCHPTQEAIPPNNPFTPPNNPGNPGNPGNGGGGCPPGGCPPGGGGNPGNGGGGLGGGGGGLGGGGGGFGGGLGQLLGPLMQGLLGGGQGGQGLFGQNPYNNPYGNQYGQNPYNNPYGQQNPYGNQYGQNPYNNQYGQNPYGNQNNPYGQQDCRFVPEYPVCGTDGRTYQNDCYLYQSGRNIGIRNQGECPANAVPILQQDCTRIATLPICGKDGKTYNNSCYMRQAGTTRENEGVCRTTATPTPVVTPNASTVLNQITISGIPSELVDAVREAVEQVLSAIVSNGNIGETVVR